MKYDTLIDAATARIESDQDADGDITGSTSDYDSRCIGTAHVDVGIDVSTTHGLIPSLRLELIRAYALLVRGELMQHGLDFDGEIAHLSRIIDLAGDGR